MLSTFNSSKVQLELARVNEMAAALCPFNSSKVQLELLSMIARLLMSGLSIPVRYN